MAAEGCEDAGLEAVDTVVEVSVGACRYWRWRIFFIILQMIHIENHNITHTMAT